MHPYTILKKILEAAGAKESAEDLRPDVFGSYVATYDNDGILLRLVWDGRDGWGYIQRRHAGDDWVDASEYLTEGDLEGEPQNHAKISRFKSAVARVLR